MFYMWRSLPMPEERYISMFVGCPVYLLNPYGVCVWFVICSSMCIRVYSDGFN